jgi:hypothetical protein
MLYYDVKHAKVARLQQHVILYTPSQIIIMMEWSNRRCYQNFTKGRSQLLGCLAYTAAPIAEVFHEFA